MNLPSSTHYDKLIARAPDAVGRALRHRPPLR